VLPWIEPQVSGLLTVGDDNDIYWEASGDPAGRAVIYLHGGPGSGLGRGLYRSWADPQRFRMIGLDQRGCGRSRPLVTEDDADLVSNTTAALIGDIEALREHLHIEQWLVVGLSWGTTLGLMYAQAHPERVTGLVLGAVGITSRTSVDWVTEQMRRVFPREWEEYASAVPRAYGERVVDAYARALRQPNAAARAVAALAWCRWEDTHMSFDPDWQPFLVVQEPGFRAVFATLVTHYWSNSGFGGDEVMDQMNRIKHLPGVADPRPARHQLATGDSVAAAPRLARQPASGPGRGPRRRPDDRAGDGGDRGARLRRRLTAACCQATREPPTYALSPASRTSR
jgi:proline iminopeptidase